jgi:RNA polymerase sigma-70 factor (ECF subfamily)
LTAATTVQHFFRHEYGRLVATLARRVGMQHLDAIEDAVQSALMAAVETWTVSGEPDNPSAWLFRVATNELLDQFRRRARRDRIDELRGIDDDDARFNGAAQHLAGEMSDELLRMLFACCDSAIPLESQLVFALKILCGFDVREIADRLFITEANVYKRLGRARDHLRAELLLADDLTHAEYRARVPGVQAVLYQLFTEGHLSSRAELAIRRELCDDAIRLATLLADHAVGQVPETFALLALMHLHAARIEARRDETGGLLLLHEQDRSRWDPEHIHIGLAWLARSARGEAFSRYHAEAGIAAEHCLAPSFEETRWDRVVECYALLDRVAPSPLHTLNRAIAVAERSGPAAGLAVLDDLEHAGRFVDSCWYAAVRADLHRRCDHDDLARRYRETALASAPTSAVRTLLARRLGSDR